MYMCVACYEKLQDNWSNSKTKEKLKCRYISHALFNFTSMLPGDDMAILFFCITPVHDNTFDKLQKQQRTKVVDYCTTVLYWHLISSVTLMLTVCFSVVTVVFAWLFEVVIRCEWSGDAAEYSPHFSSHWYLSWVLYPYCSWLVSGSQGHTGFFWLS